MSLFLPINVNADVDEELALKVIGGVIVSAVGTFFAYWMYSLYLETTSKTQREVEITKQKELDLAIVHVNKTNKEFETQERIKQLELEIEQNKIELFHLTHPENRSV